MKRVGAARRLVAAALGLAALACGAPAEKKPVSQSPAVATRDLPRVERIVFSPGRPRPGERVVAEVALASAPVDAAAIDLDFTWRLDGVRQHGGGRSFLLPQDSRGRQLEVMVIARDGRRESPPLRERVRVANREPRLHAVALDDSGRFDAAPVLEARVRAEDPDADDLVYEYRWTVDGRPADVAGPRFPLEGHRRGAEIRVEVVASDGADLSRPKMSRSWIVENAPPRIVSSPGLIGRDGVFRYRVAVADADGDRFHRYRLIEAPAGMTLDPADGAVAWSPLPEQVGTHRVVLEVDDRNGGFSRQEFELGVGVEEVPIAGR